MLQLAELRGKVSVGEASLQEAQQETLSLKEEVARRRQHAEILLARIRFLKVRVGLFRTGPRASVV